MASRNCYSDSMLKYINTTSLSNETDFNCQLFAESGHGVEVLETVLCKASTLVEPAITHVHLGINNIMNYCSKDNLMYLYEAASEKIFDKHPRTHIFFNAVSDITTNLHLGQTHPMNDSERIAHVNSVVTEVNESLESFCADRSQIHFVDFKLPKNIDASFEHVARIMYQKSNEIMEFILTVPVQPHASHGVIDFSDLNEWPMLDEPAVKPRIIPPLYPGEQIRTIQIHRKVNTQSSVATSVSTSKKTTKTKAKHKSKSRSTQHQNLAPDIPKSHQSCVPNTFATKEKKKTMPMITVFEKPKNLFLVLDNPKMKKYLNDDCSDICVENPEPYEQQEPSKWHTCQIVQEPVVNKSCKSKIENASPKLKRFIHTSQMKTCDYMNPHKQSNSDSYVAAPGSKSTSYVNPHRTPSSSFEHVKWTKCGFNCCLESDTYELKRDTYELKHERSIQDRYGKQAYARKLFNQTLKFLRALDYVFDNGGLTDSATVRNIIEMFLVRSGIERLPGPARKGKKAQKKRGLNSQTNDLSSDIGKVPTVEIHDEVNEIYNISSQVNQCSQANQFVSKTSDQNTSCDTRSSTIDNVQPNNSMSTIPKINAHNAKNDIHDTTNDPQLQATVKNQTTSSRKRLSDLDLSAQTCTIKKKVKKKK